MNKGKSKKKMNSYLKMVLIMLAGGVVGGIFGFVTSYTGENSIAAIGHGMNAFLLAVRDHTVLLECICGAICIMICEIHFGKMKRMGSQIQDAEDEEYHELQYHIEVSGNDFYIDILMYNAFMHRYLVVELKKGDFQPEYIGKLNFYCSAVDDILCREGDNQTIGLLLCQNKDRIMAEYALRDVHKPIGISDYELGKSIPHDIKSGLPSIEELESKLYQGLQDNESAE